MSKLAPWLRHELKAPLAVISGYLELLDDGLDDEARRDAMRRMAQAVAVLGELIDDVGAWVQIDTESLDRDLDAAPIVLDDLADGFVDEVERSHPRVVVDVEGTLAAVGDVSYLRQAVRLIVAAVDASAPRDVGPQVIVTGSGSRLAVALTGAELDATQLAALEPDAATDGRAARMLALAATLVRAQGGSIAGAPGTLVIDLPAASS